MDAVEFRALFEWLVLRVCFSALAVLFVAFVCLKAYGLAGHLKADARRYGWPFAALFIVCSAWAAYTAFPTSEEKRAYREYLDGQSAANSVWAGIYVPDGLPTTGNAAQSTDGDGSHRNDASGTQADNAAAPEISGSEETDGGDDSSDGHSLSAEDCEAGFVLSGIGTGETFDFTAPENAVVCDDWLRFGAHEDWFHLPLDWFRFPFGSNSVERLAVLSSGSLHPATINASTFIAPFKASLGIVPEANRHRLKTADSLFWHCFTPSNTVVFTWRNVLLERDADRPVSFQCEIFANGDFIFRYDLPSIASTNEAPFPKVEIGAKNSALGVLIDSTAATSNLCDTLRLCVSALKNGTLSSLRFSHLDRRDCLVPDRDGDGLSTVDEIFACRTDPGNADTDMDGLSDGEELDETGTDPLNPFSVDPSLPDGVAMVVGDVDPFSFPEGSTSTVLEHAFYTGTVDGEITYPEETDASAVLEVSASGSGSGVLQVGGVSVPLVAPQASAHSRTRSAPASTPLRVAVRKGVTHPVHMLGDSSLSVAFGSSGFAFGSLPSLAEGRPTGWINFPNTKATEPCIHDLKNGRTSVYLPVGEDGSGLTCTWHGASSVEVENHPPRSATLTGSFSRKSQTGISYTLRHPKSLFGERSYNQTARFCPQLEEDEEEPDPEDENQAETEDGSGNGGDEECGEEGGDNEEDGHICDENCDCWADIDNGDDASDDGSDTDGGNPEPAPDPGSCPEHGVPFEECRDEHEEDYEEASEAYPQLQGALLLRNPTYYSDIWLDVPDEEAPQCCPCPGHATNHVSASYVSGRISLLDGNGAGFSKTTESCNVRVGGVSPSRDIGDARLMFSHNGRTCRDSRHTVFGVGVSSAASVSLGALNAMNPTFGLPIVVGTNSINANLNLDLKVKLQTGRVRLSFANATGSFKMLYCNPYAGEWRTLIDTESRPFIDMDIQEWRSLFRKRSDAAFRAPVAIVATGEGHCDIEFRYWLGNGAFAEDVAVQRITAVNPPLIPDMNLDGRIDDADIAEYIKGRLFRYWFNEDTVKGDYDGHIPDYTRNAADSAVNGRYDLVNLFAARLDLKPFIDAWGSAVKFELSAYGEDAMRYCAVDVPPNEIGRIYTEDTFTGNANTPLHSAPLTALQYDGILINPSGILGEGNAPGVLAFEAAQSHENVTLWVKLGDETVLSFPMPISISSVREMYRWLNIRSVCGGTGGETSWLYEPNNLPDSECDGRHFVFVHGYNVNSADARKWGDQMFKRLRLSGSKSMFTAVNWCGNKSQLWEGIPVIGGKSLDYYSNVHNALDTAPYLATALNALSGKKIMLAHSLGNMLVSEAAKYYDLDYDKYYMLNAAVPIEAYNENSSAYEMTEHGWRDVEQHKWAANWHTCIAMDNDPRKTLKWRGRYAGMNDVINCYSPTEDVLANATANGWGGVWGAQELFKGTASLHFVPGNCEGGWGYNDEHTNLSGMLTDFAKTNNFTNLELIANPLFRKLDNEMFHDTNSIAFAQTELNKVMADAIPATSFAAGANPIGFTILEDYNYQSSERPNGWPRDTYKWFHSDIYDMSYFYIYDVFNKLLK